MTLDEIKKKLAELNTGGKKGTNLFKPKDEHVVRLIAPADGSDPFVAILYHYEVDTASRDGIVCPKNFAKPCAICTFADALKAWKGPDGKDKPEAQRKEEFELFKRIQAKARVFVPCLERNNEAAGVRLWSMTPNQSEQAIAACGEGDRLEAIGLDPSDSKNALQVLFNPEKAFDLEVSFKKPLNADGKGNKKNITVIEVKPKFKPTPLANGKKAIEELTKNCPSPWDDNPEVSSDEVQRMLEKFLGGLSTEAKTDGGTEKYEAKPASQVKENAKLVGTKDLDDALEDMLKSGNDAAVEKAAV